MRRRQPSAQALLARINDHNCSSLSDEEQRGAMQRLRDRAPGAAEDSLLPECFAIVAEAIDRRLGVWKLFDDPAPVDAANNGARIIAETAAEVASQRRYRRAGDIMLPAEFYRAAREQDKTGRLRFQATSEQHLAGIHLSNGKVVQMDAGEGKTVSIAFAAALHAVTGRRVHVVTANDYLAERDAALLEPVYRSLGLTAGAVLGHMEDAERSHIYRRSIVYAAMREFGFDHLRDNLKSVPADMVQQPHEVAIVDEADHALIDEAFTPLIISGNPTGSTRMAVRVNGAVAAMIGQQRDLAGKLAALAGSPESRGTGDVRQLATLLLAEPDVPALQHWFALRPRLRRQAIALAEDDSPALTAELYYAIQPGSRFVTLTDRGREFLERRLGAFHGDAVVDIASPPGPAAVSRPGTRPGPPARRSARRYALENQVSQALTAHLLLKRDVDYLADDDGVVLIDPHTGRPKPDSIYQHGLQSAVEAREGVPVRPEAETLAQVSVAGYVSRYRTLAGITGTAVPAAAEFRRKYGLDVAVVPPASPSARTSRAPRVYLSREDKLAAVVDEVAARHRTGQPVLVGTRTVEQSGELARLLELRGVPHHVLNAVTTHTEAAIVREAGAFAAVTVATHMAGRGTDILLESGLDHRITERCMAEIRCLLKEEDEDEDEDATAAVVEVNCPSHQQAEVFRAELQGSGYFHSELTPGGCGLRVTLNGEDSGGKHITRLDFALGLCVIGTEVHDSSRITLQLNGRTGRQGRFGLTQAFLSLEDRLVNLDAEAILKLSGCRRADAAGRVYFEGPEVTRRIEGLQAAADHEGEVQRAFMQDYAAELDRQTHLYCQRRRSIMDLASDPEAVADMCREIARRVATRAAAAHLGPDTDDDYTLHFVALSEELRQDYGVDCSTLYGLDLTLVPGELADLLASRIQSRADEAGAGVFPELARLLYLRVCGELWPAHLALLRDSVASQLLSGHYHKSAVAMYIRRCSGYWQALWENVDAAFLSRLAGIPLTASGEPPGPKVEVSGETGRLLMLDGPAKEAHQQMAAAPDGG